MKSLSLTARVSLLFAISVALVLGVTGVLITRAVESHFVEEDHQEMRGTLELINHLLARAHDTADLDSLPAQLQDALVGHHGLSVAVVNPQNETWFATSGSAFPSYLLDRATLPLNAWTQWAANDTEYRGIAVPVSLEGVTYTVAIAVDIRHHQMFMLSFRGILVWAMLLAALFTAALGWFATRGGLSPLRGMARTASSISANRLAERLPAADAPGEIRALAEAFNAMLGRLEDGFRRLSDFSSDIAHELRTPVSNLMTQTQVALSRPRTAEDYREVLESNLEEYDRLARMISDMLFLAQADNQMVVPHRESVELEDEVARLFEFYEAVATDKCIRLVMHGQAHVMGDKLMLQRALSNLLSNALRHCPPSGTVGVEIAKKDGQTHIQVSNPGLEIAPQHISRIFDRFYRADPARREGGSVHTGLGLAITQCLVRAHGGDIHVSSSNGMTIFHISLPSVDSG